MQPTTKVQSGLRVASEWPQSGQPSLASNPHPSFNSQTAATLSRHGQIRGGKDQENISVKVIGGEK